MNKYSDYDQKQYPVEENDLDKAIYHENKKLVYETTFSPFISAAAAVKDKSAEPCIMQIDEATKQECQLYKKRWIILILFVLYTMSSLMNFIEYSSIADVLINYYKITYTAADWSSMIYLLLYIPCSIPGSYILNKFGLRTSIMIGIIGTSLGSLIKIFSIGPDRYWVLMLGQGIVAIFQVLILPVPPKLAAVWFGNKESSLACCIGVSSIQLGSAVGFVIPPLIVVQGSKEEIEHGLTIVAYIFASIPIVLLPFLYFFFDEAPPTPPSIAQLQIQNSQEKSIGFTKSMVDMLKNWSYVFLIIQYGITVGIFYSIPILLNQIVLNHYPAAAKDVGIIGLLMLIAGIFGSTTSGLVLFKFNNLKQTILATSFFNFLSSILFLGLFEQDLIAIYITCGLLGFFGGAIVNLGMELAVELTYPLPEGTSGGMIILLAQIFCILVIYLYSYLYNSVNLLGANISLSVLLAIASGVLLLVRYDFKRQSVRQSND